MILRTRPKASALDNESIYALLRRIFDENAGHYKRQYAVAVVCLLAIAATTAFSAWIMRDVIDEIFYRQRADLILVICGAIILAYVIRAAAMYTQAVIMARIGNHLVARYQKRIFDKLMSLGIGFYSESRSGRLAAQIAENIGGIRDVLSMTITSLARDVMSLIGLCAVMISQDWVLSLSTLLIGPPLVLAIGYISRRTRVIVRDAVTLNSHVVGTFQEAVQGISIIKAFTMEKALADRIDTIIENARNRADKLASVSERISPFAEMLGGFAVAGVIAYGGYHAIHNEQPPGSMFAFITALLLAYDPAKRLARLKINLERAMVNARMIYEILDMEVSQSDRKDATNLSIDAGEIRFDKVDFSYADGTKVLRELTFTAPARKTTAIVGPSGAGKTTVISLLLRFYDPDAGTVSIDGQNIIDVTKSSLRNGMALVSQQPYLFEGTIRENIRYGRMDATDSEVEEAAKLANADRFIREQPLGYETPVGENGVTLSGGQRQRLSIARAIVRDSRILLLDEATSALDNESERLVQDALETVMQGRTTIVIAHRLSTIVNADKIIVMDDGVVVEEGTHGELSSTDGGLYARLQAVSSGKLLAVDADVADVPEKKTTTRRKSPAKAAPKKRS